jgi:uncharacterized protein YbcI
MIRLRGVLTRAEEKLSESGESQALVKDARRQLFESSRKILEGLIEENIGSVVVGLHSDISTKTGERIIVLTVDTNLSELFR